MADKEDLKARLRAKLTLSKIGRLPKDAKEEKIEKITQRVTSTLSKEMMGQNQDSPIGLSIHTN